MAGLGVRMDLDGIREALACTSATLGPTFNEVLKAEEEMKGEGRIVWWVILLERTLVEGVSGTAWRGARLCRHAKRERPVLGGTAGAAVGCLKGVESCKGVVFCAAARDC